MQHLSLRVAHFCEPLALATNLEGFATGERLTIVGQLSELEPLRTIQIEIVDACSVGLRRWEIDGHFASPPKVLTTSATS